MPPCWVCTKQLVRMFRLIVVFQIREYVLHWKTVSQIFFRMHRTPFLMYFLSYFSGGAAAIVTSSIALENVEPGTIHATIPRIVLGHPTPTGCFDPPTLTNGPLADLSLANRTIDRELAYIIYTSESHFECIVLRTVSNVCCVCIL